MNEERLPKTDKMLPEIGDGVIISRDRATGDVTLTKLCRKDVFMMVKLLHLNFFLDLLMYNLMFSFFVKLPLSRLLNISSLC